MTHSLKNTSVSLLCHAHHGSYLSLDAWQRGWVSLWGFNMRAARWISHSYTGDKDQLLNCPMAPTKIHHGCTNDKCFVLLMTLKPDGWKYLSDVALKGWCEWFIINWVSDVMRSDVNWRIQWAKNGYTLYRNMQIPLFYCKVNLRFALHTRVLKDLFFMASNLLSHLTKL